MSKKKDTELEIIDTADGAVIKSGKKTIAEIKEKSGNFVIVFSGDGFYSTFIIIFDYLPGVFN